MRPTEFPVFWYCFASKWVNSLVAEYWFGCVIIVGSTLKADFGSISLIDQYPNFKVVTKYIRGPDLRLARRTAAMGPPMLEKFQPNFSTWISCVPTARNQVKWWWKEEVKRVTAATFRYLGIPTQNTFDLKLNYCC